LIINQIVFYPWFLGLIKAVICFKKGSYFKFACLKA
jgi:hypothetical protein